MELPKLTDAIYSTPLSLMCEAAKYIEQQMVDTSYRGYHITLRYWISLEITTSFHDRRHFHRNDGVPDSDVGVWKYTHGYLKDSKLIVSNVFNSQLMKIDEKGIVRYYDAHTRYNYTIGEIVDSKDDRLYKLVFPGDKGMFAPENVQYIIPMSLL
jgi:hypothetical protein